MYINLKGVDARFQLRSQNFIAHVELLAMVTSVQFAHSNWILHVYVHHILSVT